jgi:hypothetical protein
MRSTLVLVLIAWSLLAGRVAHADRPKLAILDVSIDGDADARLRTQLGKSLAGGFASHDWQVIPQELVHRKLKSLPELAGCYTSTCLGRLAEALGARRFVRVRIMADGASYTLTLELLAPESTSGPVGRVERSCSPCTLSEVNDMASHAATELHEGAGARVPVQLVTVPSGATLVIDGTASGTSPCDLVLVSGRHEVVASLAGHVILHRSIDIAAPSDGRPTRVELTLEPLAANPPARSQLAPPPHASPSAGSDADDQPPRFAAWKWATAGGAVVFLVSGIAVLSIDGQTADCPPGGGRCAQAYETTAGGATLVVLGLAAGGAAAWMFFHDRKHEVQASVGVAPAPNGFGVFATGHF